MEELCEKMSNTIVICPEENTNELTTSLSITKRMISTKIRNLLIKEVESTNDHITQDLYTINHRYNDYIKRRLFFGTAEISYLDTMISMFVQKLNLGGRKDNDILCLLYMTYHIDNTILEYIEGQIPYRHDA